ncbi:MAG: hypothetical protein ACI9MC_000727, partial [Kiritimatiellia bacterium]
MRTPIRLIAVGLLSIAFVACKASVDNNADQLTSQTIGSLERVDAGDSASAWMGEELVRIVDGNGELVCDGDAFLDATTSADQQHRSVA